MSATSTHDGLARRLERYRQSDGNWRLKGLLLALRDDVDTRRLGEAWPRTQPQGPRDVVYLSRRHEDTQEHNVVRELYSQSDRVDEHTVSRDAYIARALANETHTELDVLWREELTATVAAGAASRKIARDATTVTEVDARRGDIPTKGTQPFASTGAEAANAEFDEVNWQQTAYDCEKLERAFALTDELVDQANPDVLEETIRDAGAGVENAINRQHLINVVDNANQNQPVGGNEATVQDVLEATENVTDNDFDPVDVLVLHSELRTELADDPALASLDWHGGDEELGSPFGIRAYIGSDATYNGRSNEEPGGSNTWGWEAGSEIGGVVYGSEFVHTVVYQDIETTELSPPFTAVHDLQGGVATAWTDSVQVSNDAISTITQ